MSRMRDGLRVVVDSEGDARARWFMCGLSEARRSWGEQSGWAAARCFSCGHQVSDEEEHGSGGVEVIGELGTELG
ncbi:hypothetical protein M0R45_001791 [Rubus argutus]|uniref:Uncharacterized protein n=1 Tax=Rubus argutus TaxID=59490 RepID=A0AAW1VK30_RUBAR